MDGWLRAIITGEVARFRRFHQQGCRSVEREHHYAAVDADAQKENGDPLVLQEQLADVVGALDALPETLRKIVEARVFQQKSFDEISAQLKRPSSSVRVEWYRAIKLMARHLESAQTSDIA